MTNPTIMKFGYPQTLIRDYRYWVLLVRPQQPTLGSLVLAAKSDATAYGDLPVEAFTEQAAIVRSVEQALARLTSYERINYLMLMMVDPNVHFHIIPRYSGTRSWQDVEFIDSGWPGPPDLKSTINLDPEKIALFAKRLERELI